MLFIIYFFLPTFHYTEIFIDAYKTGAKNFYSVTQDDGCISFIHIHMSIWMLEKHV